MSKILTSFSNSFELSMVARAARLVGGRDKRRLFVERPNTLEQSQFWNDSN